MARCYLVDSSCNKKRVLALETSTPLLVTKYWATGGGYVLGVWMYIAQYHSVTTMTDVHRRPLRPSLGIQPHDRYHLCLWPYSRRLAQLCCHWLLCSFMECWCRRQSSGRFCNLSRVSTGFTSIPSYSAFSLLGLCSTAGDPCRLAFAWVSYMPRDGYNMHKI